MTRTFNLADLFEVVATAVPDRTAFICGDQRLSYRELDERAPGWLRRCARAT